MIGIVLTGLLLLAMGIVLWIVVFPLISYFSLTVKDAVKPVAEEVIANTNNTELVNATTQFVESLDFQAQAFMFLAQYGWIFVTISFILGVFMATRVWIERQRMM